MSILLLVFRQKLLGPAVQRSSSVYCMGQRALTFLEDTSSLLSLAPRVYTPYVGRDRCSDATDESFSSYYRLISPLRNRWQRGMA